MVLILRWSYFRGGLIARFYCTLFLLRCEGIAGILFLLRCVRVAGILFLRRCVRVGSDALQLG